MQKILLMYACLFLGLAGVAGQGGASETSFLDEIKDIQENFDSRAVENVRPVTRETVLAKDQFNGRPFRVLTRKNEINRFKCSNCHTDKAVAVNQGVELTHGSISLNHGREGQALACIDCHHPEERDYLWDKKGEKIDFDHSYQLCGHCHFRQKRDWLGGAHGKRVANWAGERVIYNCASCHDPHSPRFEKRYPATYSPPLDR
ncbi:MAG TPA: hypothetical protein VJ969_05020 [Desulfopila sp.]|nr:hypothetical protein [Desulfopila sp.]